ncbi:MAG: bifunctional folylpolyglutamate synthase/dihydrofolate synthase [Phyllobacteriaceae bacterium]|nr:bifunctional folylpolyglutamate synthase/dihydrofolate synthase [Phyllobacteriaceae bacterium]MBA90247.1 bifunctional folylpolyglutamate synthase/dihydrofolate synthase [Phyllobacteriaceae bacterium]
MTIRPAESLAQVEIERLSALHPQGYNLSLDRVRALLEKLGNPQDRLPPVIHVAGTNGKGSVIAFARAMLEAAGASVHVHTSPHLVRWHERFRIGKPGGGELVDDAVLAEALRRVGEANGDEPATVFELTTAAAFLLFSGHPADACILEVGMGGRFDATNVVREPAVSVITPISLDHEAWLGDKVELIAAEKAGIIKPECPVVIGFQENDMARAVLEETALRLECDYVAYGQDFWAYEENGRLVYQDNDVLFDLTLPAMPGRFQLANAATAIAAVRMAGFDIGHRAADTAMEAAEWPARLQRLHSGDLVELAPEGAEIWLDGGHNPSGALVIAEELAGRGERDDRPLFLIAGMLKTKNHAGYFRAYQGLARHCYCVPVPGSDDGESPDVLAARAREGGLSAEPVSSVSNALKLMRETWSEDDLPPRILICGSLYLAGSVLDENGTPPS